MISNKKYNKNSINNLINHNYINEISIYKYYYVKNKIYNACEYLILFNNYDTLQNSNFNLESISHNHYYENIKIKNNFNEEVEEFFYIKRQICKKEKEQRKKYRMIKPFVNHYKICHDIQTVIISFI